MSKALIIGLHLFSLHSAGDMNPINPGIYVRAPSGLTAGVFRNSYDRVSVYAGWTFETEDRRFALTVGGSTGYPAKPVLPLIVPSVRFGDLRISFLPKPPVYGHSAALHFSIERQF